MIFTRDFVTRENHCRIASLVTKKSLFTVTHALFFISPPMYKPTVSAAAASNVNTLRPRQNRRHFVDDDFKFNFLNENV